jgi:O-antigen ligase
VFKKHISQNIVVAFGSLLFAVLALRAPNRGWRALWWVAAALAAANVLFMVQGRTGYVILPVLAGLVLFSTLRWRGLALAVVVIAGTLAVGYQVSPAFKTRVDLVVDVAQSWRPGARAEEGVSERLEFWHNTLAIVRAHPWLGVGTGDFERAYAEQVTGTDMKVTRNPHNQYLLTAAQTGLLGLAALLTLFAIQLRMAARLPTPADALLARGLVLTIMIGSLFNSLLIDHTESLLFSWGAGLLYAGLAAHRAEAAA